MDLWLKKVDFFWNLGKSHKNTIPGQNINEKHDFDGFGGDFPGQDESFRHFSISKQKKSKKSKRLNFLLKSNKNFFHVYRFYVEHSEKQSQQWGCQEKSNENESQPKKYLSALVTTTFFSL